MTPEYRQELKKTLATLNKIAPAKFQLLSQDIPSETKDILKEIDSILPPDAYISRSWLLQQLYVLEKELSDEQKIAIKEGIKFFNNHGEDYAKIKDNPTFESIKQTGLANCGELASALVNDVQKGRELSHVGIQNYTFFRVAINYRNCLADSMPEMQKMDTLRHIFLVYSTKKMKRCRILSGLFVNQILPKHLTYGPEKQEIHAHL